MDCNAFGSAWACCESALRTTGAAKWTSPREGFSGAVSTGSGFLGAGLEFLEAGAAAGEAAGAGTTGAEFLAGLSAFAEAEFGLLDATAEAEGSDGADEFEAGAAAAEEGRLADRAAAVAGEAEWF